jgi:hypothetical protein
MNIQYQYLTNPLYLICGRYALLRTSCGYPAYFLRLEVLLTAEGTQKVRGKAAATDKVSYPIIAV